MGSIVIKVNLVESFKEKGILVERVKVVMKSIGFGFVYCMFVLRENK